MEFVSFKNLCLRYLGTGPEEIDHLLKYAATQSGEINIDELNEDGEYKHKEIIETNVNVREMDKLW